MVEWFDLRLIATVIYVLIIPVAVITAYLGSKNDE